MPGQAAEPLELRALLQRHHLVLPEIQQHALACRAYGGQHADLVSVLHMSENSIRREYDKAQKVILACIGLTSHLGLVRGWCDDHGAQRCGCFAFGERLIEKRIVFRIGDQIGNG